jgi:dsRNA-specific ribonuclease
MLSYPRTLFAILKASAPLASQKIRGSPTPFFNSSFKIPYSRFGTQPENHVGQLKEWADKSAERTVEYKFFGEPGGTSFWCKAKVLGAICGEVKGGGKGTNKKEAKQLCVSFDSFYHSVI